MTISNSKKQLAKIIHENGGWRDGMSFSWYGNKTGKGYFGKLRPRFDKVSGSMIASGGLGAGFVPFECKKLPNWHQTILSRDEYFHLYPAPHADVASLSVALDLVTDENRHEHVDRRPTIEQLAADYRNAKDYADRKQQEADAAKADAETKLAELVAAGEALGLVLSVAPVQKYTGKFYNSELGESPAYSRKTCDAVCDGCGKRYGEHYGDRCKSGGEG